MRDMVGSWSRRYLWMPLAALSLLLSSCSEDEEFVCHCGGYYTYVASELSVPTSSAEAESLGLDLDGDKVPENRLGQLFAALSAQGFDVAGANAAAIDRGNVALLAEFQTHSFTSSASSGFRLTLGDPAGTMPAPCASSSDPICRRHLDGNGTFGVAADAPETLYIGGKIVNSTFNGSNGRLSLELSILSPGGVRFDLIGGRARMAQLGEAGIENLRLAGAVPEAELQTVVLPAIHTDLASAVAMDCAGGAPPGCGCTAGSTGRRVLDVFDAAPQDCAVTPAEISSHPQLQDHLAPDVEIDGQPAVSLGVEISLVRATVRW